MGLIKGTPYPVVNHPKGYLHSESDEVDQIKSSIASIVMTKPGERVFEPQFGCALHKINARQPLPVRVQQTRKMVASALKKWEPRIQVTDIRLETHDDEVISMKILFINPLDVYKSESMTIGLV